ncbi:MAG: hypothetical protein JEZ12_16285 [Desulfobacterium sp.]|nr:hypothetical protein [Desulfobacterium sp.]
MGGSTEILTVSSACTGRTDSTAILNITAIDNRILDDMVIFPYSWIMDKAKADEPRHNGISVTEQTSKYGDINGRAVYRIETHLQKQWHKIYGSQEIAIKNSLL